MLKEETIRTAQKNLKYPIDIISVRANIWESMTVVPAIRIQHQRFRSNSFFESEMEMHICVRLNKLTQANTANTEPKIVAKLISAIHMEFGIGSIAVIRGKISAEVHLIWNRYPR